MRPNRIGQEERYFRTGDLVQELDGGVLRFVGRKDRQVKVRGYRIELDEIELALTSIEAVEEAAVYVVEDGEGANELHAQVTLVDATADTDGIQRQLRKLLPWYALPSRLSAASEFPRTRTGKIDKRGIREAALLAMQRRSGADCPTNSLPGS